LNNGLGTLQPSTNGICAPIAHPPVELTTSGVDLGASIDINGNVTSQDQFNGNNWIQSASLTGYGEVTLNLAPGMFPNGFKCLATATGDPSPVVNGPSVLPPGVAIVYNATASSVSFGTYATGTTGGEVAALSAFDVMCNGNY
jgi:hypothetical protein